MASKSVHGDKQTIAAGSGIRSRFIVGAVALADWLVKKHLDGYKKYREDLEYYCRLIPALKNVACKPDNINGMSVQWFTPANASEDKLLYYLHGGGYLVCSTNTHRRLVSKISAEAGIKAIGINYRLAPENTFPVAVEDSVNGYKGILEMGFSPEKIVIAGDSAGGGLAVSTLVRLKELRMLGVKLGANVWLKVLMPGYIQIECPSNIPLCTSVPLEGYSKILLMS